MTPVAALVLTFGVFVFVLATYFLSHQNHRALSGSRHDRYYDQIRDSAPFFENLLESRDLHYVQQKCSPDVLTLFHLERKRLFLLWLREIRLEAAMSIEVHAQNARMSAHLEPATELKIAVRYWCLCWTCAVAWSMVHLLGPFEISGIARLTSRLSNAVALAHPLPWRDAGRPS